MIDPTKITEYKTSLARLEEIALFCLLASQNNAKSAARGLEKFLQSVRKDLQNTKIRSPFKLIRLWHELKTGRSKRALNLSAIAERLRASGIGKYRRKSRSVFELVYSGLDLRTCSPDDLEKIYNIGLKTSRFFILHTRPNVNYAVLDVHILKYLRERGYNVPKGTPTRLKYLELEKIFLNLARKADMTVAAFDLMLWNKYSGNVK